MPRFIFLATTLLIIGYTTPALASADWNKVEKIIGAQGSMQPSDVYKIGLPRSDLKVKVNGIAVKPALALGGWLAFKAEGDGAMVMGDLVLTQEEISPVMQQLIANGFKVTALHNHLLRAVPFPMYMHISGHGDPVELAKTLHAALAKTHTPLKMAKKSSTGPLPFNTKRLNEIIGAQGKADGGVYKFAILRKEKITDNGMEMPVSMGVWLHPSASSLWAEAKRPFMETWC